MFHPSLYFPAQQNLKHGLLGRQHTKELAQAVVTGEKKALLPDPRTSSQDPMWPQRRALTTPSILTATLNRLLYTLFKQRSSHSIAEIESEQAEALAP